MLAMFLHDHGLAVVAVAAVAVDIGKTVVGVVGTVVGTAVDETVAGGCTIVVLTWAHVAGACHFCPRQRTPEGVVQNPIASYH